MLRNKSAALILSNNNTAAASIQMTIPTAINFANQPLPLAYQVRKANTGEQHEKNVQPYINVQE